MKIPFFPILNRCRYGAVLLFTLWATLLGCAVEPSSLAVATEPVLTVETRDWRITYMGWNDNDLDPAIERDIQELSDAALPDSFHRVVITESALQEGRIGIIRDGELRSVVMELPGATLFDTGTLSSLRAEIQALAPARWEVIIIAAHGRGWRGIGTTATDPYRVTAPESIAALLNAPETETFLVLDVGYGMTGELLVPCARGVTAMIGTNGPRSAEGLNLERWGNAVAALGSHDPAAVLESLHHEFTLGSGSATVIVTAETLAILPDLITDVTQSLETQLVSTATQDQLQELCLEQSVTEGLPGEASVPLPALYHLAALPSPALDGIPAILLHLVNVDGTGVATGHDTTYRKYGGEPRPAAEFLRLDWAPDFLHSTGFLYQLWYRSF